MADGPDRSRCRRRFQSLSPGATEALGESLGRAAGAGLVLVLEGELGAGKTCLVRGFARGLEVDEPVSSPTFALMNEYEGRLPLLHFDAWMEGRERSFLADGGASVLGGSAVAVIEWGERVAAWLPRPYLRVSLGHGEMRDGAETRWIELGIVGPEGGLEALLEAPQPSQELLELPPPPSPHG